MTVDRIELHDVMSHENASFDLRRSLNVFTGASDSGKSAIVRALLFAMKNEPAGIDLLRHGAKRGACAEIILHCTDDNGKKFTVARRRGKSKNEYELDGKALVAFGQYVPEQIKQLFNLSEYAFQCQSDGSFLLSSTDGEVSRVLSRTVGLAEIDSAFSKIRSMKSQNDVSLSCSKMEVERFGKDRERYVGTDDAGKTVMLLNVCMKQSDELTESVCEARRIENEHSSVPIDMSFEISKAESCMKLLSETLEKLKAVDSSHSSVFTLIGSLRGTPKSVSTIRTSLLLKEMENASAKFEEARERSVRVSSFIIQYKSLREPADFSTVDNAIQRIKECVCGFDEKTKLVYRVSECIASLNECDVNEKTFAEEIHGCEIEIGEYRKAHRVCPVCGAESCYWHKEIKEGSGL